MRSQFELANDLAAALAGDHDAMLRALEQRLGVRVFLRGNLLTLDGDAAAVESGARVVDELATLAAGGHPLDEGALHAVIGLLDGDSAPTQVLDDVIWRHRATRVVPRTVGQKRYVDSIRSNTITFGIGPAGTGKTFLAVALAAAALSRREVNRIILTRPAVEAGERLGFLPGDLMAKIDPYLRPLFDALHDMIDPEKVSQHLERGVIEVAPLAFMRGRSQPLSTAVLTPEGFRPIASLKVGDLVVGSNGEPTPVIGVYPQGQKPVVRLTAQDGSSTLCCTEHLWHVYTPEDRRRGKPGRVLETQEMVGNLRRAHRRRFELPLVSRPVEFRATEVPIDPYALGLMLGDGGKTGEITPTFATRDPELVAALEASLPGIELVHAGGGNSRLRHVQGRRGGVIVANPATAAFRDLGLDGTNSETKFIPESYLHNSSEIRIAVLQGLLDANGGPVRHAERSARVQYTTCSATLRDGVIHLVRSLGGVAYARTRRSDGRNPGLANGRPVRHNSDAYVLEIRLPAAIDPFRLERKRAIYRDARPGRPMRFVDSIEPVGEMDTVCIQVAAADSLYVTEDFLVTHNTLNDSFVILDEAQNTTPEQMKMFLTRLGFGSKMVVTGDVTQVDLPREQQSGLMVVGEILGDVEGVRFVRLNGADVVRHRLVQRIVEAYEEHDQRAAPEIATAKQARTA